MAWEIQIDLQGNLQEGVDTFGWRIREDCIQKIWEMYLQKPKYISLCSAKVIFFLSAEMISNDSGDLANDKQTWV